MTTNNDPNKDILDLPNGSDFPDLRKALNAGSLQDFVKTLADEDKEIFDLAQKKKEQLNRQRNIDLKSFALSMADAIDRGNSNSCKDKSNFNKVGQNQRSQQQPIVAPETKSKAPIQTPSKQRKKLPKTRNITPVTGETRRPSSLANFKVNRGVASPIGDKNHFIQQVNNTTYPDKAKRNAKKFIEAQQGKRGTSIGDRAVVFSQNGTPHFGDSYLDKVNAENVSANQAAANMPLSKIPKGIKEGQPISAAPFQQQPRANVAPKSDTTGNLIALAGIAAAVTALLFAFQYVLMLIQFVLQISTTVSSVTNIAGSFTAILNNIGALLGLGTDILQPLEKTTSGILNNVFGKEKVDYVKYQFAKISSTFVAAQNIASKISGMQNSLEFISADNANNTSKIGNVFKYLGLLSTGDGWMREDNKISKGISTLTDKINNIGDLSSTLEDVTRDVQTAREELDAKDKEYQEKQKDNEEGKKKSEEKYDDKSTTEIPELPTA